MSAEDVTLVTLERGERDRLLVQLRQYEGHSFVDVRVHFVGDDGKLRPTSKGVTVKMRELFEFSDAIAKACELAQVGAPVKPGIMVFESLWSARGRFAAVSWRRLFASLAAPKEHASKNAAKRWIPWRTNGGRKLADLADGGVCFAIVLDVDNPVPLTTLAAGLAEVWAFVYSTHSATEGAPRWRIVVPLDRPCTSSEHPRVWRAVASLVEPVASPDYGARDPGHVWSAPAKRPGGWFRCGETEGAVIDVAAALERFPEEKPMPLPPLPRSDDVAARSMRARKYLEHIEPAISGSGGHRAAFRAATVLVRGFDLPADEALALLVEVFNPRCQPPWSLRDLRYKVKSARQRGRTPVGFLAESRKRSA